MEVKRFEDVPDDLKPFYIESWYLGSRREISFDEWLEEQEFEIEQNNSAY